MSILVLFGALFIALVLGVPVSMSLGLASAVTLLAFTDQSLLSLAQKFFQTMHIYPLLAVPFFILAGEIMNRSGITTRLAEFADALVGYLRGGLAHSNMVASVLFAGMTGAAVSDAAAFGNTLVPAMVKKGYSRPFACAVTAAG